jgi:cytochrome c oxidase assembly factor CtaG
MLWALPRDARRRVGFTATHGILNSLWRAISNPLSAFLLHAVAIWGWHAPALFAAAQDDVWIHALQHSSFFLTALLFWNAVFRTRATSLFWLFTTMLHTGFLGVLLAFSPRLWYPESGSAAAWGLTALEDQQLGGFIMWVPGGTVYVVAALALAARWLTAARA